MEQLDELDGIGPTLAQRIVEYRDRARRVPLARRAARGGGHRREALRDAARGAAAVSRRRCPLARRVGRGAPLATLGARRLARPWLGAAPAALAGESAAVACSWPPGSPGARLAARASARRGRGAALAARRRRRRRAASGGARRAGRADPRRRPVGCTRAPAHRAAPGAFGSSAEVEVTTGRAARRAAARARGSLGAAAALARRRRRARARRPPAAAARRAARRHAGRSRDPPFDYAHTCAGAAWPPSCCSTAPAPTGRRRGGLAGALDRMRERAERAVAAGMRADERGAAARHGARPGRADRRGHARRLARRRPRSPARGQRPERDAARRARAAAADAGRRSACAAGSSRSRVLIALYVPLAGRGAVAPARRGDGAGRASPRWPPRARPRAGTRCCSRRRPRSRWNPRAWGDPGWQLSFAAVAGILTLGVPLQRALRRVAPRSSARRSPTARRGALARRARSARARRRRGHHGRRHARHRAAARPPLRLRPARRPARPTCSRCRRSRRPCGSACSRAALGQLRAGAAAVAAAGGRRRPRSARPRRCRSATSPALAERFADMPGGQLALPLGLAGAVVGAYAAARPLRRSRAHRGRPGSRAGCRLGPPRWRALPRGRRRALAAALRGRASWRRGRAARAARPAGPPHRPLPRRRPGRRHADPAPRRHRRPLRRRPARRPAWPACCAGRACGGSPLVVATHASRDHHGGLPDGAAPLPGRTCCSTAATAPPTRVPRARCARPPRAASGASRRSAPLTPHARRRRPAHRGPVAAAAAARARARGPEPARGGGGRQLGRLRPAALGRRRERGAAAARPARRRRHEGAPPRQLRPGPAGGARARLDPSWRRSRSARTPTATRRPSTLAALRRRRVPTYRTDRDGTVTLTVDGRRACGIETERLSASARRA